MGTQYEIKIFTKSPSINKSIKSSVDSLLFDINQSMSTYIPNSEINNFNKTKSVEPVKVSKEFWDIVSLSIFISKITNGYFDITIMPLVDFWGFGPNSKNKSLSNSQFDTIKKKVGYNNIKVNPKNYKNNYTVTKLVPDINLDFSAIAKGYAVNQVSKLLNKKGFNNHLVNIGGEIKASGKKGEISWVVGVTNPLITNENILEIDLENMSIATSGVYFNFIESDTSIYSHIIDPFSGLPIMNNVISVTVISKNCSFADGLATGLMLSEVNESIDIINNLNDSEAMILELNEHNEIEKHFSKNFKQYISN